MIFSHPYIAILENSPSVKRDSEKADNFDMGGDVPMEEFDPLAQQCNQSTHHLIEELPCLQSAIVSNAFDHLYEHSQL